nr:LacI family DNA-binding transcriptional regulator [Angustibacter aerolatus]
MTTMRDVAVRAGVSAKTVSRVVNKDRYVSDDVRERVERAIDEPAVPTEHARRDLPQRARRGDRRGGAGRGRPVLRQHHRRRRARGQPARRGGDRHQRRLGAVARAAFDRGGAAAAGRRHDHRARRRRHDLPAAVAGAHAPGVRRPLGEPADRRRRRAGRRGRRRRGHPAPARPRAPAHRVHGRRRGRGDRPVAARRLPAGAGAGGAAGARRPRAPRRDRHALVDHRAAPDARRTRAADGAVLVERTLHDRARPGTGGAAPQRHRGDRLRGLPDGGVAQARRHRDRPGRRRDGSVRRRAAVLPHRGARAAAAAAHRATGAAGDPHLLRRAGERLRAGHGEVVEGLGA